LPRRIRPAGLLQSTFPRTTPHLRGQLQRLVVRLLPHSFNPTMPYCACLFIETAPPPLFYPPSRCCHPYALSPVRSLPPWPQSHLPGDPCNSMLPPSTAKARGETASLGFPHGRVGAMPFAGPTPNHNQVERSLFASGLRVFCNPKPASGPITVQEGPVTRICSTILSAPFRLFVPPQSSSGGGAISVCAQGTVDIWHIRSHSVNDHTHQPRGGILVRTT